MKHPNFDPTQNHIGSTDKQKKYTYFLFLISAVLNYIAFHHDIDYQEMLRQEKLSKALKKKLKADLKFGLSGFYFGLKEFEPHASIIAPLGTVVLICWTPIYMKRNWRVNK